MKRKRGGQPQIKMFLVFFPQIIERLSDELEKLLIKLKFIAALHGRAGVTSGFVLESS